ncbi:Probable pterin-4-alpha-carbinolamine dehydratase, chloroplastic [Linum grandiflorum]
MTMATSYQALYFSLLHPPKPLSPSSGRFQFFPAAVPSLKKRTFILTRPAAGGGDLGDFGARDPFPAEIESQFGNKVLGYGDSEHKILIPNISALSLAQLECSPVSPVQPPMSKDDAQKLLKKVVGWRLVEEAGGMKLQCLWKLRDFSSGVELINRIQKVISEGNSAGHFPNLHIEQPNQVRAELWTSSIGGLSMNDFIVAAKIDGIKTSDLAPRKRVWA